MNALFVLAVIVLLAALNPAVVFAMVFIAVCTPYVNYLRKDKE